MRLGKGRKPRQSNYKRELLHDLYSMRMEADRLNDKSAMKGIDKQISQIEIKRRVRRPTVFRNNKMFTY